MDANNNSALLVMDVQPNILSRIDNSQEYLSKVKKAVGFAHKNNIPIVYVVVGFRAGLPEISRRNQSFSSIKNSAGNKDMINPLPAIEAVGNDVVVTKRRVSAFTGSDLDVVLSAKEINHLILSGIATSGVVLSTLRQAADKDYELTVLSDLCADMDDEVHRVLTQKVFPRQAKVITSEEWMNNPDYAQ